MPEFTHANPILAYRLPFEGAWPSAVAFVGDGGADSSSPPRVVAGNREGRIVMWDPASAPAEKSGDDEKKQQNDDEPAPLHAAPPPVRMLRGHDNGVTRLIAVGDGRLLSASLDRTIRLWDTAAEPTGQADIIMDADSRERRAKRNKDAVEPPAFTVAVLPPAHTFDAHTDWVQGLALSADRTRMISGDDDAHVIVWDFAKRQPIARWKGHPMNWVCSAAISPDGKLAFVAEYCHRRGDFDRPPAQARIYESHTGKLIIDLLEVQFPDVKERDNSYGYASKWSKFVGQGFVAAAFSPDGKLLAVGQGGEIGEGRVHLIDPADGKLVRTVAEHKYGALDLLFTADGKHVLSSGRDTTVQISEVESGKTVATLGKPRGGQFKDWVSAIALSPDQRWIAAADIAGHVDVWQMGAAD